MLIGLKIIIQSIRIPFLILTPVCVFLGVSTIIANQESVDLYLLALALSGALFAHISVNTLNEYSDFNSGLDLATTRTPFSGGSGALPGNPEMVNVVFAVGVASLAATLLIGGFFVWKYGLAIVPVGIAGIILIITYTGWINKSPYLCLISPGLGFGFLMVVGTQFVLTGRYMPLSWLVAVIPFFLVNNLLLINQYPDIQADASVGRNHIPIAYGIRRSNMVYGIFALAVTLFIITCVMIGYFPVLSLIVLLSMPLAVFTLYGAIKYGEEIGNYPQYPGANVTLAILAPLLLGLSLVFG